MATVLSFDGTIVVWLVEEELDDEELEELELEDDDAGVMHGGTISVETLELAGTTSWFDGFAPEADCAWAPPGVTSTVLEAGGETAPLEEELDELELEEELEAGGWQGWTATVWVTLPGGIVTVFEPVGGFDAPCWAAAASEHGGTATVSGLLRGEICTVRTPGFIRAVDTGSEEDDDELDDEDELPPQAASPVTITALTVSPATRVAAELALIPMLLLLEAGAPARLWLVAAPVRQALPTRYCGLTRRLRA